MRTLSTNGLFLFSPSLALPLELMDVKQIEMGSRTQLPWISKELLHLASRLSVMMPMMSCSRSLGARLVHSVLCPRTNSQRHE